MVVELLAAVVSVAVAVAGTSSAVDDPLAGAGAADSSFAEHAVETAEATSYCSVVARVVGRDTFVAAGESPGVRAVATCPAVEHASADVAAASVL